ncbi:MAG: hypothetical protein ACR2LR_24980 [Hassallia sp.]
MPEEELSPLQFVEIKEDTKSRPAISFFTLVHPEAVTFFYCVASDNADKAPVSKMREFINGKTVKHSSLLAVIALCTPMRESNRL